MFVSDITKRNTPPFYYKGQTITLKTPWGMMDGKKGDKFVVESCITESLYVVVSNGEYYPLEAFYEFFQPRKTKE